MTPTDGLRDALAEIADLATIQQTLHWDFEVMMPPAGAGQRAEELATMERILHERQPAPAIGELIDAAASAGNGDADSDDAALVRVARRDYDKVVRVPGELRAAMARAGAHGHEAWVEARKQKDFSIFEPHLRTHLELKRRYVDCYPDVDDPYDVLLDDYEPGFKTADVVRVFDELKTELVPFVAAIAEREQVDASCLEGAGAFPVDRQEAVIRKVLERMGFDEESWRLDVSVHPFASGLGANDIRITTRYDDSDLRGALFGAMHETGHGLYEAGSDPALDRTPLRGGASLGLHESQSRLWENLVGRGRPFAGWVLPLLQETFPAKFADVDADGFYRAVNRVQPSLIRVESDEATYGLHIILRFELEREMLSGEIDVADLPEIWNERVQRYLGIEVPDAAVGVLQDVHWSEGILGYFPTYQLGNIVAAQIWAAVRADLPDLDDQLARGEFAGLREWLRERLHHHGRKYMPAELVQRVTGGPLDVAPYLDSLRGKLGPIYGLAGCPPRARAARPRCRRAPSSAGRRRARPRRRSSARCSGRWRRARAP
jgi:carboxypeptidase Taq